MTTEKIEGAAEHDTTRPPEAASEVVTVVLIEDNRLVREGITSVLNRLGDIRVVAVAPGNHSTVPAELRPHVVLLDVGPEPGDSLDVALGVIEDFPGAGVIVMDLLATADDIMDYIGLGVSGFIMKDAPIEVVAHTIREVAAGRNVLPGPMTASLFSEISREAAANGESDGLDSMRLTPRETEVIELIAEAKSNKAIARDLHISIHTVKSHLRNIMKKLNLHSRLELARYMDEAEDAGQSSE